MLKRVIIAFAAVLMFVGNVCAQKIGIALSGGGARGCTHLGIIKALEENEIPIDYIVGTSMGAVVGSFYAMGYTIEEIEDVLRSDEFGEWMSFYLPDNKTYNFRRGERTPEFVSIKLVFDDSIKVKPKLPQSIINPVFMNYAMLKLYGSGSAVCNGNFDSLFIPFRCVASDIFEKKSVVHRKGDLATCLRSSMAFPFIFRPVMIDGKFLVDGGIYDNFPIHKLDEEFDPDYIIGSSVTSNIKPLDEGAGMYDMLECMVTLNQDFTLPEDKPGHIFEFRYDDVSLLEFDKMDRLIQIGYDSCMAHIDEIKECVVRRKHQEELMEERAAFKKKIPPLVFRDCILPNLKPNQKNYIKQTVMNDKDSITINEFKDGYMKLLSDHRIESIEPKGIWKGDHFDILMKVDMQNNLELGIGGNVSSTLLNQLYFGADFQGLLYVPYEFKLMGQVGNAYTSLTLGVRVDLPTEHPTYLKFMGSIQNFVFRGNSSYLDYDKQSVASKYEAFLKQKWGCPFFKHGIIELSTGAGYVRYSTQGMYKLEADQDLTRQRLWVSSFSLKNNTMPHRQFSIEGMRTMLNANFIMGREQLTYYDLADGIFEVKHVDHSGTKLWFQVTASHDQYFKLAEHFRLGFYTEAGISNWGYNETTNSTLIRLPAFAPTIHTLTTYLPQYHSTCYAAVGLKPIVKFTNQLHLRYDAYLYGRKDLFGQCPTVPTDFNMINELTFVALLNFLTASLYGGTTTFPFKDWSVGLNIGFLIFGESIVEK